jgi:hypothetical protein
VAITRVLPDTNVCYPISLLDLVLRCDEASLVSVLWTEDLLAELTRTWVAKGVRSVEAAEHLCQQIRSTFVGQDISRAEYESLIDKMPGRDPDDHVHAAAAASRAPVTLLTNNIRDFPRIALGKLGVTVQTPDEFLLELLAPQPGDLIDVVREMATSRHNPAMTIAEMLEVLGRAGVPRFAELVRQHL